MATIINRNHLDRLGPDELRNMIHFLETKLPFAITNTEHLLTVDKEIKNLTVHNRLEGADKK